MRLEHLLEPIEVGPITIKNRIVRSAHGSARFTPDYYDHLIAYHAARARGGVGLVTLESVRFHDSDPFMPLAIDVRRGDLLTYYRRLKEETATTGVRIIQQLDHRGRHIQHESGSPGWSASAFPAYSEGPYAFTGNVPLEMTHAQIEEIIGAYVDAARIARDGGLDGVEIKCAYSLVTQFLSPAQNFRTDEYGGSREHRLRFLQEILRGVRAEVGGEIVVGVKMTAEDSFPGGLTVEETRADMEDIAHEGLMDYLSLTIGDYGAVHRIQGMMDQPHAYQLGKTAPIAQAVKTPTILVGRIMNLTEAEEIVASGQADMVAMVRPTIADPELVRKTLEGRVKEVRPCIGINDGCIGSLGRGVPMTCAVNVAAGRELLYDEQLLERAAEPRRLLVVGAGPPGLEAARVAALRGHEVTLVEARDELGGQVQLARRAPYRDEIGLIVDWFGDELKRLGVDVRLETPADGALVRQLDPAAVIVATGSTPSRDGRQIARPAEPIEGAELDHVFTSWDVLEGSATIGNSAIVFDDIGHYEAVAVAEELVDRRASVHFVSRFQMLGPLLQTSTTARPVRERFHAAGVVVHQLSELVSVAGSQAILRDLDCGAESSIDIDTAVLVLAPIANRAFLEELTSYEGEVRLVGDALGPLRAPGFLMGAIHEGHHAARDVLAAAPASAAAR
jgi:2,4-dienoyl-CoA reductase-like NADH-dependent reductase (Old Yellow Enzyme family)